MLGYYPNTLRYNFLYTQDKLGSRRTAESPNVQKLIENSEDKEVDFTQTIGDTPRRRSNSLESTSSSFHQSVQVVPGSGGKYEIYPGAHDPAQSKAVPLGETWGAKTLHNSRNYRHNISNPDLWRNRVDYESDWLTRKESVLTNGKPRHGADRMRKTQSEGNCNCGKYHSHKFRPAECSKVTMITESFTESISKKSVEVRTGNANQLTIYNIFWSSKLAFSDYKHGMNRVSFQSLWPKASSITDLIKCGVQDTGLRNAFWELCVLSILSGPLTVLKALLDLSYIRKYIP